MTLSGTLPNQIHSKEHSCNNFCNQQIRPSY